MRKKSRAIQMIRKAEQKQQCVRTCKAINNPQGNPRGLDKIIINNNGIEITIQDPKLIESNLIEYNIKHFAQARHTPCASGNLAIVLENNGLSKATTEALKGEVEEKYDENVKRIVLHLKQVRKTQSGHLQIEKMIQGFKNGEKRH
jgi:hypothetical protein